VIGGQFSVGDAQQHLPALLPGRGQPLAGADRELAFDALA